jgi:hypothetical protein
LHKKAAPEGAAKRQTTAMKAKTRIDPMKGVVNPDLLIDAIRRRDYSYVRGALQWLERNPPNPFVVKFLKKALERIRSEH